MTDETRDSNEDTNLEKVPPRTNQLSVVAAVCSAMFTFVAAIFTGLQYCVYIDWLDYEQTPFLSVTDTLPPEGETKLGTYLGEFDHHVYWNYSIENYGRGVATQINHFDYISFDGGKFKTTNRNDETIDRELAPNQHFRAVAAYPDAIDPPYWHKIYDNTDRNIVLKVVVKYKSYRGRQFSFELCQMYFKDGEMWPCDKQHKNIEKANDAAEKAYR